MKDARWIPSDVLRFPPWILVTGVANAVILINGNLGGEPVATYSEFPAKKWGQLSLTLRS